MADHKLLRLSAPLLFVGELLSLLAGFLHPSRENPNNHRAVFAEYANSVNWTAVHFGQFVSLVVIIAGLPVLCFASLRPPWNTEVGGSLRCHCGSCDTCTLRRPSGSGMNRHLPSNRRPHLRTSR